MKRPKKVLRPAFGCKQYSKADQNKKTILLNLDQTLFRNCCDFKKCYPIFIFDDLSWGSSLIDSVKLTGYYICCKY